MYKILVLKNSENIDARNECLKAVEFFASRPDPIQVEFYFKNINISVDYKIYKIAQGFNSDTGQPMLVDYYGLADSVKDAVRAVVKEGEYNCVMFISEISVLPAIAGKTYSNWTNFLPLYFNTGFIQIVYNSYLKQTRELEIAFKHELMHDFCYTLNRYGFSVLDEMDIDHLGRAFYRNNFPEDLDSNFGETFKNIKPYINKLNGFLEASPYVWFKMTEKTDALGKHTFSELDSGFRLLLDKMRGQCGFPWKITSGYRTTEENAATAGAVTDSAHVDRIAVDILCVDSVKRDKIIDIAKANGVKRIGIGKDFVHIDVDKNKPQGVMWHYY